MIYQVPDNFQISNVRQWVLYSTCRSGFPCPHDSGISSQNLGGRGVMCSPGKKTRPNTGIYCPGIMYHCKTNSHKLCRDEESKAVAASCPCYLLPKSTNRICQFCLLYTLYFALLYSICFKLITGTFSRRILLYVTDTLLIGFILGSKFSSSSE